jgi:hypothetical protein
MFTKETAQTIAGFVTITFVFSSTEDLAKYASEQSPPRAMMLVVNKADFLTEYQRLVGIFSHHLFLSSSKVVNL